MKFIKDFESIYLLLFWAFTPIVISILPVIPYLITNDATWLIALFLSIPLAATAALTCWDFSGTTGTPVVPSETKPKQKLNRIQL